MKTDQQKIKKQDEKDALKRQKRVDGGEASKETIATARKDNAPIWDWQPAAVNRIAVRPLGEFKVLKLSDLNVPIIVTDMIDTTKLYETDNTLKK